MHGVDADDDTRRDQSFYHRQHAILLLLDRYRLGMGSRRLSAHIDEVGTLVPQSPTVVDRRLCRRVAPTIGERVRGDIDNAHHRCATKRRE